MADEPSNAELGRRLDEIKYIVQNLVGRAEYEEFRRHVEHRFSELEADLLEKRRAHENDIRDLQGDLRDACKDIKEVRDQVAKAAAREQRDGAANFRQGIYNGVLPGILCLVTLLVTILLTFKGAK